MGRRKQSHKGNAQSEPGFRSRSVLDEGPQKTPDEVFQHVTREISSFGRHRENHEERIRELLGRLTAPEINNLRYRMFAPHYDRHMEGHERAIDLLLRQLVALERTAFPNDPLIRPRMLEMSCGTGMVIDRLLSALPPERAGALRMTANDLSDDMKAIARAKLSGAPCGIDFASQDLTRMDFPSSSFDTAVLSQTLHLITDADVVAQERSGNYMSVDNNRHLNEKRKVIENAFRILSDQGTFVLIDEWPALLSDRGGPLGPGFAYLFNDSLRGIDWGTFRNAIMSTIPTARFVAQVKVPIDQVHTMYLWVYRKEQGRTGKLPRLPPGREFEGVREDACGMLVSMFNVLDRHFIESAKPPEGGRPWVRFLSSGRNGIDLAPGDAPELDKYNWITISRRLHDLPPDERLLLLERATRSLKLGGSLIIIDEWPEPKSSKYRLKKSSLRSAYMSRFSKHLVFAGALRVAIAEGFDSGMYGYQYRRVL